MKPAKTWKESGRVMWVRYRINATCLESMGATESGGQPETLLIYGKATEQLRPLVSVHELKVIQDSKCLLEPNDVILDYI